MLSPSALKLTKNHSNPQLLSPCTFTFDAERVLLPASGSSFYFSGTFLSVVRVIEFLNFIVLFKRGCIVWYLF